MVGLGRYRVARPAARAVNPRHVGFSASIRSFELPFSGTATNGGKNVLIETSRGVCASSLLTPPNSIKETHDGRGLAAFRRSGRSSSPLRKSAAALTERVIRNPEEKGAARSVVHMAGYSGPTRRRTAGIGRSRSSRSRSAYALSSMPRARSRFDDRRQDDEIPSPKTLTARHLLRPSRRAAGRRASRAREVLSRPLRHRGHRWLPRLRRPSSITPRRRDGAPSARQASVLRLSTTRNRGPRRRPHRRDPTPHVGLRKASRAPRHALTTRKRSTASARRSHPNPKKADVAGRRVRRPYADPSRLANPARPSRPLGPDRFGRTSS